MTLRRNTLWWLFGTFVVLSAAIGLGEATGWPFLRQPLQDAMSRAAGVAVRLDDGFRVSLIGRPGVRVGHLNVAPAAGIEVPHLLDARRVELDWRWADVWRWRQGAALRIQRLDAAVVDAHLSRVSDGRASWHLGASPRAAASASQPGAALTDSLPRFGTLRVAQGHIVIDDEPLDTRLRVALRGGEGEAGGAAPVSGASAPAAPGSAPLAASAPAAAGYHAQVTGRWRALPLELQVRSGSSLPLLQDDEGDGPDAPDVPVRVEGRAGAATILFDGHAAALLGERRLRGRLHFRGPSLARVGGPLGLTLPQTPPFDLRGELGHVGGVWHLRADRAAIGRSLLNGDFRYDSNARPGRLTGRLGGPRLLLADLAPAVGGGAEKQPAGKVLPQRRFDLPSLRGMNADVRVAVDELDFGSDALAPLRNLRTQVVLDGGVLQLRDLKAVVAGGQFSGTTQLDARAEPARWGADVRFAAVDIAGWLKGMRSESGRAAAPRGDNARALKKERDAARQGGDRPVQAYLTGVLNGQVQATGQGRSTAEILGTLDGQARLMLRDGTVSHLVTELAGLDVAQALGVVVRSDRPLPLRCARVDLVLQRGVARPRLALMDNADSTVRVAGEVDLRNETLALRVTTRPKDFSPLSLRTPVLIGGTLAAPQVGVEGKRLAGRVLGALALGAAVGPAAALLPLIDRGDKEEGDPCADKARPSAKPP